MTLDALKYSVIESYTDSVSEIEFWSNGIVYYKLKDNTTIELEDSKQQFLFLKSRFNGVNKHTVLVEPGFDTGLSKEAREFSSKPESNEMTAY